MPQNFFWGGPKGYSRGTIVTNDPLYLDQHILKEAKTRQKNVAMAWIEYKKAYDMVTQTCV